MVWGALIGAAIGLYSAKKSSKAASQATAASSESNAAALALDKEALDFEKQRYNDWKAVFGDVQDNLKKYYMGRNPAGIAAQNLEAFEIEKTRTLDKLRENFAARGIETSGLAIAANENVEIASMQERARIRAEAPATAAAEQLGFLSAGLGNDPSNAIMAAQTGRAQSAAVRAGNMATAAGTANAAKWQTYGAAGEAVVNAIEALGNR